MLRAPLAATFALALSCAPPAQNGGVDVRPGASDRMTALCRFHGDPNAEAMCGSNEKKPPPSRVVRIEKDEDKIGGPLAVGRAGDLVIENDEVAFVIDQIGRGFGFAESGGNLVDAADATSRRDELGELITYFGEFPRQAVYDAMKSGVDPDGAAWIEVRGRELYEAGLAIVTRYSLAPGSRALAIATRLTNTTAAPITLDLGDAIQWGSTEKIAPGKTAGFRGDSEGAWIAGVGRGVSYAIASPALEKAMSAKSGTGWSDAVYAKAVAIAPGATVEYSRSFLVGVRGDALAITNELVALAGKELGGVDLALADAHGSPISPAPGGRVVFSPIGAPPGFTLADAPLAFAVAPPRAVVTKGPSRAPDAAPASFASEIPPGRYSVTFEGGGRASLAPIEVTIEAGKIAKAKLALGDGGAARVHVREGGSPVPAKIQVFDANGARLDAPISAIVGEAEIALAVGKVRVVASRGPEYTIADKTIDVASGAPVDVELDIKRVVDTKGFLSCDFHQHSSWSPDSGVSIGERIAGDAAEGLECALASEHNAVYDADPVVRALGLEKYFRTLVGEEVTTDASKVPFGHLNVWPLVPDPNDARGGAFAVRDRKPKEIFDEILARRPRPVIQVNHPRAGNRIGYFEQLHFDPKTGAGDADYDARFDALEVWSGRYTKERDRALVDLWALLDTSHVVTPTANTDTHGTVGYEGGYPRTFVAVDDDDPSSVRVEQIADGIRSRRDVVLSNGPFVTIRAGAAREGGVVSLGKKGAVEAVVHVEVAPWVDASELTLVVGGERSEPIPLKLEANAAGALAADVRVNLAKGGKLWTSAGAKPLRVGLAADSFVVAIVTGKKPLEPVLSAKDPAEILPFAMTAPLYVDVDGDGKSLGR